MSSLKQCDCYVVVFNAITSTGEQNRRRVLGTLNPIRRGFFFMFLSLQPPPLKKNYRFEKYYSFYLPLFNSVSKKMYSLV